MKRFSKFLVLAVISFALILVGCSSSLTMPNKNAVVYGNGGNVVQKGKYLYFANSFTPYSALSAESDAVKINDKQFGIYRTKLTNEFNTEIDFDENGFAKGVELVSSRLAGFESLGMYIIGDYLFFASPNTHKTASISNRYDLVSFFSVKLDGSGLKELYTTFSSESTLPAQLSKIEWKIYTVGETNYLITLEDSKIVRHTINGKNLSDKTVLADDVKNAVLTDEVLKSIDQKIYYTTDFSEESGYTGTILKSVNIHSKQIDIVVENAGETVTLLAHQNSRVFYTIRSQNSVKEGLYVIGQTSSTLKIGHTTARTNFFYMGDDKPVVFTSNSKIFMQNLTIDGSTDIENLDIELLIDADVTVLFVSGDYVYYTDGSSLMRISYKNKVSQTIIEEDFDSSIIDFDGKYVYAYKTLDNAESEIKYLHRVKVSTVETSEEAKFETVGFVMENDKQAVIKFLEEESEDNQD